MGLQLLRSERALLDGHTVHRKPCSWTPALRLETRLKRMYTGRQKMLLPEGTVSAEAPRTKAEIEIKLGKTVTTW